MKVYRYSEIFEAACHRFLQIQCFERSPYCMRYIHIKDGVGTIALGDNYPPG